MEWYQSSRFKKIGVRSLDGVLCNRRGHIWLYGRRQVLCSGRPTEVSSRPSVEKPTPICGGHISGINRWGSPVISMIESMLLEPWNSSGLTLVESTVGDMVILYRQAFHHRGLYSRPWFRTSGIWFSGLFLFLIHPVSNVSQPTELRREDWISLFEFFASILVWSLKLFRPYILRIHVLLTSSFIQILASVCVYVFAACEDSVSLFSNSCHHSSIFFCKLCRTIVHKSANFPSSKTGIWIMFLPWPQSR